MLEGRLPDTVPRPEPMPVAQPEVDDEAVSLETLEAAGTTSHERFHEKYMDQEPEPKPTSIRHRYGLTPRTAREAVIWATIFSKPKGML